MIKHISEVLPEVLEEIAQNYLNKCLCKCGGSVLMILQDKIKKLEKQKKFLNAGNAIKINKKVG